MKVPKIEGVALVTGASGFIGRLLRDALLDAGTDVVAVRRAASPEPKRGRSVVVDYEDREGLRRAMAEVRPTHVFHVAGATKGVSYEDFRRANVMPTENLLAAVRAASPDLERFVLVSSLASFGPSRPDRPHREDHERRPIEHYGKSKLEAERLLESEPNIPWTVVRPGGVYGPGDVDYLELFKSVEKGLNLFFGNERRYFSAVFVEDLIRAIVECAVSPAARGHGYFICDGRPITWGDFQQRIVEASGKRVRSLRLPELLVGAAAFGGELLTQIDKKPRLFNKQKAIMGAQEAWTCQHDAAREDFGYAPTVDVREGVRRTLDWYRRERWL